MNALKTSFTQTRPFPVRQCCLISVFSFDAPINNPFPLRLPDVKPPLVIHIWPSHHDPHLPRHIPSLPIPHCHLCLHHQQVTLEDQSSATRGACASSRSRPSPISFLDTSGMIFKPYTWHVSSGGCIAVPWTEIAHGITHQSNSGLSFKRLKVNKPHIRLINTAKYCTRCLFVFMKSTV